MGFISRHKLVIIGLIVGAIGGYLYYHYAGCTGTCAITSRPFNSTIYGSVMGGLIFSLFKKETNSKNKTPGNE